MPPAKRGRGKQRPVQESEASDAQTLRAQHLQDKNRRAQQRFRERQKAKVSELLEQVDKLNRDLEALQNEKTALANQGNVLEKVLAMKEEHIHTMDARIKSLESEGATRDAQDGLHVTDAEGAQVTIGHADMLHKLRDVWTGYIHKLAGSLVEGGSDNPSEDLIASIDTVVTNACETSKAAILYDPVVARKWFLSSMEDPDPDNPDLELPQTPWRSIVRSVALSAQQRKEICELRKMYCLRMQGLMDDISRLPAMDTSFNPGDIQGRSAAKSFLVNSHITDALKASVTEHSNLQVELESMLFKGILTRLQMARMMVQSYPLLPDGVGLVNFIYQQDPAAAL